MNRVGPLSVVLILLSLPFQNALAGDTDSPFAASTDYGSLTYALEQPDGTRVSISTVEVSSVRDDASSFFMIVRDPLLPWIKAPVLLEPLVELRTGITIDVDGIITTLRTGERAILAKNISFYLDEKGQPCALPPAGKTIDASAWPWKTSLDVDSGVSAPLFIPSGQTLMSEPPPGESLLSSWPTPPEGSIAEAKTLNNGESVSLSGKIVTARSGKFTGCIYIEEPDRSCGIRVVTANGPFAAGDQVSISGSAIMATTADHERFINNATVTKTAAPGPLKALGMLNREVAGRPFRGESAIYQRGVLEGVSQNNVGLWVKVWGEVKSVNSQQKFFYIDDGSNLDDTTGNELGLRVSYADQSVGGQ